ncbi:hypothetical protein TSUD_347450 [Trifolium subterraneum]|nr:hypothetical protein TSUD_347450 [Trifolium subterraneum]
MAWSPTCATRAYLDTLQLCNNVDRKQSGFWRLQELGSNEFVSALAAGMKAKLIVEVTSSPASSSTIALAVAARQTGGKFVCILPEPVLDESRESINSSGLKDQVEFRTEDPSKILPCYKNIDFSLIDCKDESYAMLLNLLDVNPVRSVVVANNLVGDRKGLEGCVRRKDEKVAVRSVKHPIGKGMEVTMISKNDEINHKRHVRNYHHARKRNKSKWIVKFDEKSGEEHIFKLPHVDSLWN